MTIQNHFILRTKRSCCHHCFEQLVSRGNFVKKRIFSEFHIIYKYPKAWLFSFEVACINPAPRAEAYDIKKKKKNSSQIYLLSESTVIYILIQKERYGELCSKPGVTELHQLQGPLYQLTVLSTAWSGCSAHFQCTSLLAHPAHISAASP